LALANRRVQGREQRVLDQRARPGQPVEQARLARVGVAGDRHGRDHPAAALLAHRGARLGHVGDLAAQLGHLGPDPAPVSLDLGLAGASGADATAAGDPAAGLPGHRLAPAAEPGEHVLHLGQLDLRLALSALGVLGEDVQDQRRPVDDLDLHDLLELAELAGRELVVADHGVRPGLDDDVAQLLGLSRADVRGGVGLVAPLDQRL
jgi:hypothetical protein